MLKRLGLETMLTLLTISMLALTPNTLSTETQATVRVSGYASSLDMYGKSFDVVVIHDVAVTGVACKNIVGRGHPLYMDVLVTNEGLLTEIFNVTACTVPSLQVAFANFTEAQTVTLAGTASSLIRFVWDTTDVAKGNHTLSVIAGPVVNETDTDDNSLLKWVIVTIFGDVDGNSKVDILDVAVVAQLWGCMLGKPGPWNPNADLDDNGAINILDIARVAREFGKRDP